MLTAMIGVSTNIVVAQDIGSVNADSDSPARNLKSRTNEELLREGTMIPPTVGSIVPVGRRWGFAPANPESLSPKYLESGTEPQRQLSSGMISKPRPTRLGTATVGTNGRQVGQLSQPNPNAPPTSPGSPATNSGSHGKLIILAENLMLQRIVEAVVADSQDDRWTISGEITEFRNQNRLRIHTAQRTNEQ